LGRKEYLNDEAGTFAILSREVSLNQHQKVAATHSEGKSNPSCSVDNKSTLLAYDGVLIQCELPSTRAIKRPIEAGPSIQDFSPSSLDH
jgi:hypothetical protein